MVEKVSHILYDTILDLYIDRFCAVFIVHNNAATLGHASVMIRGDGNSSVNVKSYF